MPLAIIKPSLVPVKTYNNKFHNFQKTEKPKEKPKYLPRTYSHHWLY